MKLVGFLGFAEGFTGDDVDFMGERGDESCSALVPGISAWHFLCRESLTLAATLRRNPQEAAKAIKGKVPIPFWHPVSRGLPYPKPQTLKLWGLGFRV